MINKFLSRTVYIKTMTYHWSHTARNFSFSKLCIFVLSDIPAASWQASYGMSWIYS